MVGLNRRRLTSGLIALAIGVAHERGLGSQPARAGKSKGIKFDISGSQFRDACSLAGGEFADWGGGDYACYFAGWRMECSKTTGRCRITCDPGVKCVKSKRLADGTRPTLNQVADQMAPVTPDRPSGPLPAPDAALGGDRPLAKETD